MNGSINRICIKNVLHVPNCMSICSWWKLVSDNLKVQFNQNECIGKYCDDELVAIASREFNFVGNQFCKGACSGSDQLGAIVNGT